MHLGESCERRYLEAASPEGASVTGDILDMIDNPSVRALVGVMPRTPFDGQ